MTSPMSSIPSVMPILNRIENGQALFSDSESLPRSDNLIIKKYNIQSQLERVHLDEQKP